MKYAIGFIVSWALFLLGHWISRPMFRWEWTSHLYTPYNWLMTKSVQAQDWGGKGPWSPCDKD